MPVTTGLLTTGLRIARAIDRITGWIGQGVAWLVVVMVLVGAFNAVARYSGRYLGASLSSNALIELQWYLFSAVFLLGGAYALREDAHVRVDVLFGRLPPRAQAWINILGTLLLLLPFCLFTLWVSYPAVRNSWRIREGSPDPGGLARWPLKALILACFALLLAQGIAELIKQVARLRDGDDLPTPATADAAPREGL